MCWGRGGYNHILDAQSIPDPPYVPTLTCGSALSSAKKVWSPLRTEVCQFRSVQWSMVPTSLLLFAFTESQAPCVFLRGSESTGSFP